MKLAISQAGAGFSVSVAPGDPIRISMQATAPSEITVAVPGSLSGPEGPPGPQGIQGIPGLNGSGAQTVVYTQAIASASWHITHNLGVFPSVVVADSAGTVIEGDIQHHSINDLTLTFAAAFAGLAYLI